MDFGEVRSQWQTTSFQQQPQQDRVEAHSQRHHLKHPQQQNSSEHFQPHSNRPSTAPSTLLHPQQNQPHRNHEESRQPLKSTMASTAAPIPAYTPYHWNLPVPSWSSHNNATRADALSANGAGSFSAPTSQAYFRDEGSQQASTRSWEHHPMYPTHSQVEGVPYPMSALYGPMGQQNGGAPWTAPAVRHGPLRGLGSEGGQQGTEPATATAHWPSWPTYTQPGPSHSVYSPYQQHNPTPGPSSTSAAEAQARWVQHEHRPANWTGPVMTSTHNEGRDTWDGQYPSNGTSEGSDGHRRASSLSAILGAGNADASPIDSADHLFEERPHQSGKASTKKSATLKDGTARKPRRKKGEAPKDWAQRKYVCEICSDADEPVAFSRPSALRTHQVSFTVTHRLGSRSRSLAC